MSPVQGDADTGRSVERFRNRTLKSPFGELLIGAYHRRGPVTITGRHVLLLGPDANRFVFANPELFCNRAAFESITTVGETALVVTDGEMHRHNRQLLQLVLHQRKLERHVATIAENADTAICGWRPGQRIDVDQSLRSAIRCSAIKLLIGQHAVADAAFLGERIRLLLDLFANMPQIVTWMRRLSTPQWRRGMAACRGIDERIYAEIARARNNPQAADGNLLDVLIRSADETGEALSDSRIRDQMFSLISGAETISDAMAFGLYAMLSTPGVWDQAAAEVHSVIGDRRPDAEDLRELPYVNGVVREVLRLYAANVASPRFVNQDFDFAGRRVKRGSMVVFSPYVTHRLPEVWSEPLAFRPERWDPADPSYRKRRADEYLPFAAGPHRCIGADLTTTTLTVVLIRLLGQRSLSLPEQRIRPTVRPVLRLAHNLHVDVVS
jgi:cytochrome P450